jgi:DNA-binding NarL/FixJ family response regulator
MRLPELGSGDRRFGPYGAVVLDRQPLWLAAVAEVLERAGFDVVGATTSEAKALRLVREHRPDVLIFEPEACTSSASRLLEAGRMAHPQLKAVAVSSIEDPEVIRTVLQSGVWAYVLKRAPAEDIVVAVRQAFVHSIHLARPVGPGEPAPLRANASNGAGLPLLTRREREILALVAEGHSNSAMAKKLWVTEQTVKFHLSNIYRKVGVPNRTAATRWAHEHGFVDGTSTASSDR